jgi:heme/copper-type cytochrome/quinol oxidase subunit 3
MVAQVPATEVRGGLWNGGISPFTVGSKKLGMWLFILSDALTFSAVIMAYSYIRVSTPNWPTPFTWSSVITATVMTFLLLSSSITMVMAVDSAQKGLRGRAALWIGGTMAGGLGFLVLHANEWRHLIVDEGMTPLSNKWGTPMFGGTFFAMTGMHMLHVSIGVIYLLIVATGFRWGKFDAEDVEVAGLYWHFVDLVWMFIFPMVYLLSMRL